eukprot:TRINITY_DN103122_c0_g1_i1.p1 TRINITY_DN103122_c0_g1~~TRINITY_DN103122_c0_g1_i1.p1  ORF type:complete len:300 (-),score=59.84 TRINITY_DN103122_c0_g1_i1:252-1115(-)
MELIPARLPWRATLGTSVPCQPRRLPGFKRSGQVLACPTAGLALAAFCWRSSLCGGTRRCSPGVTAPSLAGRHRALSVTACSAVAKPLVVFVIGGPGSGKGTQCELVSSELGFVHLSAGELLREERRREGSELGALIEEVIKAGKTVPSEVIVNLLEQAMRKAGGWQEGADAAAARFVVDGYPRSEAQLEGWQALSPKVQLLCCLNLEVSEAEMERRLMGRAATSGRLDDNEETIRQRFKTFQKETAPLLAHFESEDKLRTVDGARTPSEVFADVRAILEARLGEVA